MTIGTAIVTSVAIICVTFVVVCIIGASLAKKKSKAAEALTTTLTDEINKRLKQKLE